MEVEKTAHGITDPALFVKITNSGPEEEIPLCPPCVRSIQRGTKGDLAPQSSLSSSLTVYARLGLGYRNSRSRLMSRAVAEWVNPPMEIKSTPVCATARLRLNSIQKPTLSWSSPSHRGPAPCPLAARCLKSRRDNTPALRMSLGRSTSSRAVG